MATIEARVDRLETRVDRIEDLALKNFEKNMDIDKRLEILTDNVNKLSQKIDANIADNKERMNKIDQRMDKFEEDSKHTREYIQHMMWANIGAWAAGIIAVLIAVFATTR